MSQPYVGEIRMVGFSFAPVGWALCDGQLLAISENDTLFNLIGTTYGGDGQNTFALPNLQSRIPVHQGSSSQGTFVIGQLAGVENVTLQVSQMPAHAHLLNAQSGVGTQASPSGGVWADSPLDQFSAAAPTTQMSNVLLQNSGGSQPHNNIPPYLSINFVISLFGIFPSQN
ncbi:MAG: tail fiber protein [Terracidiphilus sp.]|nr:tail fiber protein [Terracidiphilus sp.]